MGLWILVILVVAVLVFSGMPAMPVSLLALAGGWVLWTRLRRLEQQVASLRQELDARRVEHAPVAVPAAEPDAAVPADAAAQAPAPAVPPSALTDTPAPSTPDLPPAPMAAPDDWDWGSASSRPEPAAASTAAAAAPDAWNHAASGAPPGAESQPTPVATASRLEPDESSPDVVSSLGRSLAAWLTGGNTIVRAAVAILFIGVAFLLRYAAEHTTVPIELRLCGVALGGLALVALGWRLRGKRRGYALSLQGGGIGVIYLTLFAAFRLYGLLPGGLAFGLLAALAAVTALLAVLQNALPLAVLGFAGGFLAPVLTSTGQGSHVALFSYYLVLNLAIAWIASRQTWKLLNLVGFFFTFGIGLAWGMRSWRPELLASTEPFLVAHVLLYLYISVQYSSQLIRLRDAGSPGLPYVDGGLLFGMPIAAFGLQAAMVRHLPYALAVSAAVMAGIYLLLGRWLLRQGGQRMLLLTEGMLALGVIFLALVTPLALDARWTGAAWAIQGAGLAWIAMRQQRIWALAMGLLLQMGGALSFWSGHLRGAEPPLFANGLFVGALVLGLSALVTARLLERAARVPQEQRGWWQSADPRLLHAFLLGAGTLHLLCGAARELGSATWAVPDAEGRILWLLLAWTLLTELLHRRLDWPALSVPGRLAWALAALLSLGVHADGATLGLAGWTRFTSQGWAEALAVAGSGWWLLRRLDLGEPRRPSLAVEHLAWGWSTALHGAAAGYLLAAHLILRHAGWTPTAAIVLPTLLCVFLAARLGAGTWPASVHPPALTRGLLQPWLALLLAWTLAANLLSDGGMAPLPYLPLLNPVDLGHALVALYALRLAQARRARGDLPSAAWTAAFAAAGFAWVNSLLVRTLHHWAGTPAWTDGALSSSLVQTSLTILWTLLALVTMLYATRRAAPAQARIVWAAGAALLGLVVAKLLLVDMDGVGALYRIVSFIGVGLLMLVIGYVSPLPPAAQAAQPKEAA